MFKLHEYRIMDETWKFNVILDIHNHALNDKLAGLPVICRLVPEERELLGCEYGSRKIVWGGE